MQYKNTPKIKVLQMPWNLNMIFSRIFQDLWNWEHTRGVNHLPTRVEGAPTPLGRPPCLMGPQWPSSTYSCAHPLLLPPTNTKKQLKHEFQPPLLWFSISLLEAPLAKLLGEIVLWYVTAPMVQLVFVLVLYLLQNFAPKVTLFLSLHVKFIWSKVVLMHDIASRHLWE